MIFSTQRVIVCSFDQSLGLCQISQPVGTDTLGWHRSVLPSYITWGARNSPVREAAKTAVI